MRELEERERRDIREQRCVLSVFTFRKILEEITLHFLYTHTIVFLMIIDK